jgi:hypothetical protein
MGEPVMPTPGQPSSPAPAPPLAIRYAAASDRGLMRERNQDAGYAGPALLAVADGFGPAGRRPTFRCTRPFPGTGTCSVPTV